MIELTELIDNGDGTSRPKPILLNPKYILFMRQDEKHGSIYLHEYGWMYVQDNIRDIRIKATMVH